MHETATVSGLGRTTLSAMRPWLVGVGSVGMVLGVVSLWVTQVGWGLVIGGAACVALSLAVPSLERMRQDRVRAVIGVGFLVVAAVLVQHAREEYSTGGPASAVFALIGVAAAATVGVGGLSNVWAVSRLARGKGGRATGFFARHWQGRDAIDDPRVFPAQELSPRRPRG